MQKCGLSLMAALIAAGVCAEAAVGGGSPVVLAPSTTEVVVAPDARQNQKAVFFAAVEMTNFLSRALGSPVPIVTRMNPGKRSIVLGSNDWSVAAGIDTAKLPQDGFALKTRGDAVYIAGVDANRDPGREGGCFARATLFGVYEFLEKYVGCRFYFPGELGEIVPRVAAIRVPAADYVSAPALIERNFSPSVGVWYDPDAKAKRFWPLSCLRLRMQTKPVPCCHGLRSFRYVPRFSKTHPEYFQMKRDGTRDFTDSGGKPHWRNNKFCFSSDGLKEEIYRDVKAYLTGEPASARGLKAWGHNCAHGMYVDIMPEDGPVHCSCPSCTAAYARAADPKDESNELIWNYTVDLAERLKREGVKGYVTQMAYSSYRNVPKRKIPDNVIVTVCNNGAWVVPERMERDLDRLGKWADNVGKVKIYSNCGKHKCIHLNLTDVPTPTPRAMAAFYNRTVPMARGAYCCNSSDRALYSAINWYVFSRAAWYGKVNVDALLEEYYRLMFGAGAAPMKSFFEELERKWMKEVLGSSIDTPIGAVNLAPNEFRIWTQLYSPAKVAELAALVDAAAAAVPEGSLEARRIALMRRELVEPMARHAAQCAKQFAVEPERKHRRHHPPKSLVADFRPVTLTAGSGRTDRANEVRLPVTLKRGSRYRVSFFANGRDIRPSGYCKGAQVVVVRGGRGGRDCHYPAGGLEGTFDPVHVAAKFYTPKDPGPDIEAEIVLRLAATVGTVTFEDLILEKTK